MDVSLALDLDARSVRVTLSGELDAAGGAALRAALTEAGNLGGRVVVDLSAVPSIDSAALGVLVSAHRRARAHGRALTVTGAAAAVARSLHVSGLDRVLHVVEAAAVAGPAAAAPARPRDDRVPPG